MPSEVWKFFKKVGDKAICDCGDGLKLGKSASTSQLAGHLNSARHKELMRNKEIEQSEPKRAKVESIANIFSPNYSKQKSQELISDLTDYIVDSNLPFSTAESPYLRRLIRNNYGQAKFPSRYDVSSEIPLKANKCIENLRTFVRGQKLSLTLDEFSHKEHSLLCITGSYLTEAFQFQSKVLAVESFLEKHTGENIAQKINSMLGTLQVAKTDIVAATRDGAPNLAGQKGGGCYKANIESFHCFCHMLHLVVWDGINGTSNVSSVVEKGNKIGVGFHRSPTASAAFRELQGLGSINLTLQIKTRWNSTLEMLSSLLRQKSHLLRYAEKFPACTVAKQIKNMSENDFEQIEDIVQVLHPFLDCTKMASFHNAPLSCYPFFVRNLSEHLENLYGEFAVKLNESLESRTRELLNQSEVGLAAFLDPRLCYKLTVMPTHKWEYAKEEIVRLLRSNEPKTAASVERLPVHEHMNDLWGESDSECVQNVVEGDDAVMEEVNRYLSEKKLPLPRPDMPGHDQVYQWWEKNRFRFPRLAVLARTYLSISLSSVASERCFSKASLLFANSLRSRLGKQTAANLIIVKAELADEILKKASESKEEEPSEIIKMLLEIEI